MNTTHTNKGLIINHNSSYCSSLHKLFPDCDIISYSDFTIEKTNDYSYFILSGGEINISGIEDIKEEKEFIKTTKKPIFGVCLGMQIISICFGQKLLEIGYRVKGTRKIDIFDKELELVYNHGWYIPEAPDGFNGGKDEHVQYIYNDNILAFQAHPELSGESGLYLKEYFIKNYL